MLEESILKVEQESLTPFKSPDTVSADYFEPRRLEIHQLMLKLIDERDKDKESSKV